VVSDPSDPSDFAEHAAERTAPAAEEPTSRITEIGAPEQIDRLEHPVALAVGLGVLVLLFFVGVVAFGSSFATSDTSAEVAQVVLPRMAGRDLAGAQAELERLGLIVDIEFDTNEVVPLNIVIDQDPIAGSRIEVGEQVQLRVSDGPAGIDVPDMAGLQGGEAVKLLQAVGLLAQLEDAYDETIRPGEVVGSEPASGTRAPPGSTVVVRVSQGPAPRTVPEIAGTSIGEAIVALSRADLTVGDITRQYSVDQPSGTVVSSEPPGGAQAPRDQPVALVVTSTDLPIDVPDLVGLTRASAGTVARDVGLTTSVTTQSLVAGDLRIGVVISQVPVAGSRVADGSVSITVGALETPTTTTVPGAPTTTADGATTTTVRR